MNFYIIGAGRWPFYGSAILSNLRGLRDKAKSSIISSPLAHDGFRFYSRWGVEHYRDGKCIYSEHSIPNMYVDEGIDYILNHVFKYASGSAIDPWYVGIQATNNPASGWTMANQGATWNQFTDVDEATWPEAVDGALQGDNTIDMSQVTFNISASGTVYGAHLTSNSTKGATSGTLLCAVNFSTSRAVIPGDDLLVTYTVGCQDDGV